MDKEETKIFEKVIEVIRTQSETIRRLQAETHGQRIAAHRAEERGRVEDIAKAFDAYQFATDQHRKAQELNIFGDNAIGENKAARECARTFDALRAAIRAGHDPDRKGQGG